MTSLLQDLRFAIRKMLNSPGFVLTAVLTLALGIAANVIVFGVMQALVLRPIDVPQGERVMTLAHANQDYPIFSYPEVRDVRDGNTVFSAVAAHIPQVFGMDVNGITRPVWGNYVSGQYFEVVGIKPVLGRLLQPADDDHPGASNAVALSWTMWKNDFGSDPEIVGKTANINKHPYTIIGVTPEGFYGTEKFLQPDIFVPMANEALLDGDNWLESRKEKRIWSIVRLKDGVTVPQVQAELNTIAARIARQYPKDEDKLSFKLTRPGLVGDFVGGPARGFLAGVMGLAGIVLLAACANLGGLFAARTADHAREFAIRLAIGSSRWRIVRQILCEALVIAVLGGTCACGLAWLAIAGLANWHPPIEYPFRFHIQPQPSLILIAFLISLFAGALFGTMPLRQIFKTDPNDAMRRGDHQFSAGRRWALRDVLLMLQIALCCVTVTAAFVSLRGLTKTLNMKMGFNPKHAVLTQFELSQAGYTNVAADHLQRQLQERVAHLPGVTAAAYADATPLAGDSSVSPVFSQQTTDLIASNSAFRAYNYKISPGFFTTAEIPLLAGRDVSFSDTKDTPAVAVVNREFARRLFQSADAVGRYFKDSSGQQIQIVGMVEDGKYLLLSEAQKAAAFFPISQQPTMKTSFIVRTHARTQTPVGSESSDEEAKEMAATIRKVIRDLDPAIPIESSGPWYEQLGLSFFMAQVATVALGMFGAFGLLLSLTGTFGLASYTVSKRLRELSLRIALGAQPRQIISDALGRVLILLASGAVVGMLLGVAASRVLSTIVYEASAQDPLVLGAVVLTLLLTGTLAVARPVRSVLRILPANLLREQ